jgi:hypothetical protein
MNLSAMETLMMPVFVFLLMMYKLSCHAPDPAWDSIRWPDQRLPLGCGRNSMDRFDVSVTTSSRNLCSDPLTVGCIILGGTAIGAADGAASGYLYDRHQKAEGN